jgi:hypothetical protein
MRGTASSVPVHTGFAGLHNVECCDIIASLPLLSTYKHAANQLACCASPSRAVACLVLICGVVSCMHAHVHVYKTVKL